MSVVRGPSSAEREMLMVRVCPQQKAALQFRACHALGFSIQNNSEAEITPWPFLRVTDLPLGGLINPPILCKRRSRTRDEAGEKKKKKGHFYCLPGWHRTCLPAAPKLQADHAQRDEREPANTCGALTQFCSPRTRALDQMAQQPRYSCVHDASSTTG